MYKPLTICVNPRQSAVLFLAIGGLSAAEPWPQQNGPSGNFSPLPSEVELLDDLSKAKQLWQSDDPDLGFGKGSVSGYLRHLSSQEGHPGSCSAPILADGKIFVTSFRPAGEAWAEKQYGLDKHRDPNAKKPLNREQLTRLESNLRLLADDLLVAIDAKTGKTLWKAAEVEAGLNRYMGKRQGYNVSPAYHDGKVFSVGTTGLLRAYHAKGGEMLWERPLEKAREAALKAKAAALEKKILPGGMGWNSSLVVAGGVLVVPLFDGIDLSLRGVNPGDGATLWEVEKACSRHATPSVWTHAGKQFVLTATVSGKLQLIDPADGSVKWTVEGLGENHFSLTPTEEHVFVNAGAKTPRKPGDDRMHGKLAAYKLGTDKAELAWVHPEEPWLFLPTWMDSCARRFIAVGDRRVYYYARGVEKGKQHLTILDESNGEVLDKLPWSTPAPLFVMLGDKLFTIRDASHGDTVFAMFSAAGDRLKQLAEFWSPPHIQTTAYEVLMENPIHNGLLYIRTQDGRVACYDLREPTG